MPYIGKQPLTGAYQLCDTITTSATATYNLLVGGSAVIPGSAQNCIVSLNGVIQAPVNAFTVSGSQITFASALTSSDVIDFILILGNVFDIGTPTNGSVTNSSLNSNVITGQTAETSIAGSDLVLIYDDSATALRKMTKTNLFSGITNSPAFSAYLSASQTINNDTHTTAQFNTEVFDTNSNYDTTNYRFLPTVSGKYIIGAEMMVSKDAAELKVALMRIRKNGSTVREVRIDIRNSTGKQFGPSMVITGEANGSSDYFDVSFYADTTEATAEITGGASGAIFYGYKIIE